MNNERVRFAVVGHPNKGKSSIVSTLSQDDSIGISTRSGTTTEAEEYGVEDERSGYRLIDTPGFQRPHKVLQWLQSRATTAELRSKAVAEFVADEECQKRFPDEVKLLKPLVEGAAILYVVDGSRPYGSEYEAEMEILRWSGQPSMALINPIESDEHVEGWKNALEQYFKLVRIFNPMAADFDKQLELIEAFTHLKPQWSEHLKRVTENLRQRRETQKHNCSVILTRLVDDLCFYQQSQKVLDETQATIIQPVLEKQYFSWMIKREKEAFQELLANYQHFQTNLEVAELSLPPDLFDCEQWYMWGLSKTQLAVVTTIAGAAAGASADLLVAGSSFMMGAVAGSILGFSSAWFGADKLLTTKVKGLPLGGYEASYGPMKNKNFPYVVIGRFLHLYQQISERNHAVRESLDIQNSELQNQISSLEKNSQKELHSACGQLVRQNKIDFDKLQKTLLLLF